MIVPLLLGGMALILSYIGSRKQLTGMQLAFVTFFFLLGAVGVVFRDSSMRLASALNVGRGADLLLYFSVLCGVLIAANFYFRFKTSERILTEVVRQLAMLTPKYPDGNTSKK